ncbi:MAG: hypothetical protein ACI8VL_001756, partial [Bacteroidia bacterium]
KRHPFLTASTTQLEWFFMPYPIKTVLVLRHSKML